MITEEKLDNLGPRDREMLRSILELEVTTAREITVPNLDINCGRITLLPAPITKLAAESQR